VGGAFSFLLKGVPETGNTGIFGPPEQVVFEQASAVMRVLLDIELGVEGGYWPAPSAPLSI
jgi:hypothetical protein